MLFKSKENADNLTIQELRRIKLSYLKKKLKKEVGYLQIQPSMCFPIRKTGVICEYIFIILASLRFFVTWLHNNNTTVTHPIFMLKRPQNRHFLFVHKQKAQHKYNLPICGKIIDSIKEFEHSRIFILEACIILLFSTC